MFDHPMLIVVFVIFIIGAFMLDLGLNRKSHSIAPKEALAWSIFWIVLSQIFAGVLYWMYLPEGSAVAMEKFSQFQSAYWIEKALSVDNLFVFIMVFAFFQVPDAYKHKVLTWGILGALVMRAIFIFAGVGLINLTYLPAWDVFGLLGTPIKINVIMTLFGAFLVYAGIKTLREALNDGEEEDEDFSKTAGARFINWMFKGRVLPEYVEDKFIVRRPDASGKIRKYATALLVVVGVIEFTDLLFAVDSIPAIFAIAPNDPVILYTSNIFAIFGLRALFYLLNSFIHMFKYLPFGLSIILAFIGIKMLSAPVYHIDSSISLMIVLGILVLSVVISLIFRDKELPTVD